MDRLTTYRLPGLTGYHDAWNLQQTLLAEVSAQKRGPLVLLLEHPKTITMGRRGGWTHLRTERATLEAQGFVLCTVDRGGDITYHGPGQLVGYPILNLRALRLGVGEYVRLLEGSLLSVLSAFGIHAQRVDGFTGVWCGRRKICAIGVRVCHWTTMHGFALNIGTQLEDFRHIVPCGLSDCGVTSMSEELGRSVPFDTVASAFSEHLGEVLHLASCEGELSGIEQLMEKSRGHRGTNTTSV